MDIDLVLDLLRSGGSIVVNKRLAKNIGIGPAIIYSELASRWRYFKEHRLLTEDGFFYNEVEDLKEATTYSDFQQRRYISKLISFGLIEYRVTSIPPRRYFRIVDNTELILSYLSNS